MERILMAIDEALERKGLSASAASRLAVGHPSLVKNLRNSEAGTRHGKIEGLARLADVLGLEFYFGPPRADAAVPPADPDDYVPVRRMAALASAGPGALAVDEEREPLAFRRDWLDRIGVTHAAAALVESRGDSMFPTIWDRDTVLVDTAAKAPPPVRRRLSADRRRLDDIYVVEADGDLRIKRLERPDARTLVLSSDNAALYPPEVLTDGGLASIRIVGRAAWWCRTGRV